MNWTRRVLGVERYDANDLGNDLQSSLMITFLAVPQGVAYAMIAGLPPAMGLYASALPTLVGSLLRSSRHVVTGPSNALSLLVGGAVIASSEDPVTTALALALLVGTLQVLAGALRLGVLVDYISTPVVIGYITGAGVLIGVGQLPNLTATAGGEGHLIAKLATWWSDLPAMDALSVGLGLAVAVGIVLLRRWRRSFPGMILVLGLATLCTWGLGLPVHTLGEISPTPAGLPPLTVPSLDVEVLWALMPAAVAATVLSLVESSSVARAISVRSGQRLVLDREFVGQGVANLVAAFSGGYPTSGSLSRSAVNHQSGAKTRLAGMASGLVMVGVLLLLGPAVDHIPVAALAGLLMVVAVDLVDTERIRTLFTTRFGDAAAFVVTMVGTWALPLDKAIYLGVAISIGLFLRRVRHLGVFPLAVGENGRLQEGSDEEARRACPLVRILHVEGQLFFASASELERSLNEALLDPTVQVLVVRLKRAQGLDVTAAEVFSSVGERMRREGRHLFLVGMKPHTMQVLRAAGVDEQLGEDRLFPSRAIWFAAMNEAIGSALTETGLHTDHDCALSVYVANRRDSEVPAPTREGFP